MNSRIAMNLLSVLVLVSTALVTTNTAWAWGRGHRLIRSWAVDRLPDWQRELLDDAHWKHLLTDYILLQDRHAGGNAPELDKYCSRPASLYDPFGWIDLAMSPPDWVI